MIVFCWINFFGKFWQIFVLKCKLEKQNAFGGEGEEGADPPKFQNNTTEFFWAYDGKYYHYKII
jgi:hypothetical protein